MTERATIRATDDNNNAADQHGGNLSYIISKFPNAPQPLLDLSTCVNPYGYAFGVTDDWPYRLPDTAATQDAHAAAAGYYGVSHTGGVTLAPGMQSLIFALASLRMKTHGASRVAILSPTYGEHGRVWKAMGHEVTAVSELKDIPAGDVVILCNPNNPDGRSFMPDVLLTHAERLALKAGWLIVDESFADCMPEISLASSAARSSNIAVLRSCGKFFGISGLRVSAAIAPPSWSEWLRMAVGPWPVSAAACDALPGMFKDGGWINATRARLDRESNAWRKELSRHGSVIGHTSLFTLVEVPESAVLRARLAAQGIMTRVFPYNPRWLRFGLPALADRERILAALGPRT